MLTRLQLVITVRYIPWPGSLKTEKYERILLVSQTHLRNKISIVL